MAINPLGSAGPATLAGAGTAPGPGEHFGRLMKGQAGAAPKLENQPIPVQAPPPAAQAAQGKCRVDAAPATAGLEPSVGGARAPAAKVLDQVTRAQQRMEQILTLAESGRSFSPAELLSLQAHVYRASQELDLAGKVVEKTTGGVKQVLQTQV
jgi:hypothetical protein